MVPVFGAAIMLHQIKAPQFDPKTLLNPPVNMVNCKIQGLFKTFECFSSTFKGKFNFQGLFKTVLYIQVLFKPVRTPRKKLFSHLLAPKTDSSKDTDYNQSHLNLTLAANILQFLLTLKYLSQPNIKGAQWLSGRVLDSRLMGRGFEPHRRHCIVVLEQDTFILA